MFSTLYEKLVENELYTEALFAGAKQAVFNERRRILLSEISDKGIRMNDFFTVEYRRSTVTYQFNGVTHIPPGYCTEDYEFLEYDEDASKQRSMWPGIRATRIKKVTRSGRKTKQNVDVVLSRAMLPFINFIF